MKDKWKLKSRRPFQRVAKGNSEALIYLIGFFFFHSVGCVLLWVIEKAWTKEKRRKQGSICLLNGFKMLCFFFFCKKIFSFVVVKAKNINCVEIGQKNRQQMLRCPSDESLVWIEFNESRCYLEPFFALFSLIHKIIQVKLGLVHKNRFIRHRNRKQIKSKTRRGKQEIYSDHFIFHLTVCCTVQKWIHRRNIQLFSFWCRTNEHRINEDFSL